MRSRSRFLRVILSVCCWMLGSFLFMAQAQPNGMERAKAAQNAFTDLLLGIRGVVGTAIAADAQGQAAVLILVADDAAGRGLPRQLNGVPASVIVTGEIFALRDADTASLAKAQAGAKIDPKSRFVRPVPIGVSTGNGAVGSPCAAGTIGARVKDASGNFYALSNNHVYALENSASIGNPAHQPGPYDTGCVVSDNNIIGNLFAFVPIVFSTTANNTVDAAIVGSLSELLGKATPSNGYGTPKSGVAPAAVGQAVQKYGRTTSLTKGQVVGVNATINVGYGSGTARFVDQIVILGTKPFSKAGDSGSLIVTNPGRQPVGLLFAGSSNGYTFANRIDLVLAAFSVSVDGE